MRLKKVEGSRDKGKPRPEYEDETQRKPPPPPGRESKILVIPCERIDAAAVDDILETSAVRAAAAIAVGRRARGGHAAQLVLAGELAAQLGELGNQVLADLDEGVLGCDGAVGLNADEELRHIRVSDYARCKLKRDEMWREKTERRR